jgi:hypothetical protein
MRPAQVAAQVTSVARARELDTGDWCGYFEAMGGEGLLARVTVLPEQADGRDGEIWWPLRGIRYDPHADEIEIHVGNAPPRGAVLHYFVAAPRSIRVQRRVRGDVIAVDDASGARTLIHVSFAASDRQTGEI